MSSISTLVGIALSTRILFLVRPVVFPHNSLFSRSFLRCDRHTAGGIEISDLDGGADGSSFSFSSQFRDYSSWGIAQFLDTRCMVEGRTYMLQASVKLVDQDGSAYTCTPGNNQIAPCPSAHLRSRFGTTNPVDSSNTIATMDSWTTGDWNKMTGTFTVTGEEASAGSVLLAWHRTAAHVKVILDEITLSCVSGC